MKNLDRMLATFTLIALCAPFVHAAEKGAGDLISNLKQATSNLTQMADDTARIEKLSKQGGGVTTLNGVTVFVSSVPYVPPPFAEADKVSKLVDPADEFTLLIIEQPYWEKSGVTWFAPYLTWKATLADYDVRVKVIDPAEYGVTDNPAALFYRGANLVKAVNDPFPDMKNYTTFISDVDDFLIPTLTEVGVPKTDPARKRDLENAKRELKDAEAALRNYRGWEDAFARTDREMLQMATIEIPVGSPEYQKLERIQAQGRENRAKRQEELKQRIPQLKEEIKRLKAEIKH